MNNVAILFCVFLGMLRICACCRRVLMSPVALEWDEADKTVSEVHADRNGFSSGMPNVFGAMLAHPSEQPSNVVA